MFFLESGRGGHFSIAAWQPLATVQSIENGLQVRWRNGNNEVLYGEPLTLLEELVASYQIPYNVKLPVFQGEQLVSFLMIMHAKSKCCLI